MFTALLKLLEEPKYFKDQVAEGNDPDSALTEVDFEEQNAGYQAAYSRLAASASLPPDPIVYVRDPKEFLTQEIVRISKSDLKVNSLLGMLCDY
jgi:exportin-2 (importin alpha re-exporter)